jgi:hypothetical protein
LTSNIIDTKLLYSPYREIITPSREPDFSFFSPEELGVLSTVSGYFKGYSTTQISDFSHKEEGYLATAHKYIIPYSYSVNLQID